MVNERHFSQNCPVRRYFDHPPVNDNVSCSRLQYIYIVRFVALVKKFLTSFDVNQEILIIKQVNCGKDVDHS